MTPYEALLAEARGRPFAAIVGWPVELSRSPALHGYWLKKHGLSGYYGRLPVEPNAAALQDRERGRPTQGLALRETRI